MLFVLSEAKLERKKKKQQRYINKRTETTQLNLKIVKSFWSEMAQMLNDKCRVEIWFRI